MNQNELFPRTVRPTKSGQKQYYNITACRLAETLTEDGNIGNTSDLISYLPTAGPTCIVKQSAADFLSELDEAYKGDRNWNWRCTSTDREIITPAKELVAIRVTVTVQFFGWKDSAKRGNNRYHMMLDPVTFYGRGIDEIIPGEQPIIHKLLQWGVSLRDWCNEVGYSLKPTAGALSSQCLRDKRFYPEARRKIPKATNQLAREHLPGNHYQLFTVTHTNQDFRAIYLDQRRAHHYHAKTTQLPCSNSLFAYGDFQHLENISFDSHSSNFSGLYYGYLSSPKTPTKFACSIQGTTRPTFFWSNELPTLLDLGFSTKGIIAAWGSYETDKGIPKYSQWSTEQLDKYKDAAWLKPILLSTYGILAVKPREMQSVFRQAKKGKPATLFTGHRKLHGLLVKATNGRKIEPGVANVIHRGLIESATRTESLGLAHWLDYTGYNILSIYADAVIIEQDEEKKLPFLPEPWRIHSNLNHLQFINTQAFVSGEMTKLPGIAKVGREIINVSRGTQGSAPAAPLYESLSGRRIKGNRKIYGKRQSR